MKSPNILQGPWRRAVVLELLVARRLLSVAVSMAAEPAIGTASVAGGGAIILQSEAQESVLDSLIFGNTASETAHSFTSTYTQVISGALGQTARQATPRSPVEIYGGDMTFTMAVDPVKRNYFTVKLWGSDDTDDDIGRLYLYVPIGGTDYQVGYRHEGDYMPLSVAASKPPLPGRFFYSTTLLPLWMTQGKTSLTLKIVSSGRLYGLGSGGPPDGNYQYNMTMNSRGIYRAYTHTAPLLDVSGETQGSAPTTTTRPTPTEGSVLGSSGTYTTGINNFINARLSADVTTFTTTHVELLARSYSVSQLSAGYQNAAIVNKVVAVLDSYATYYHSNPTTAVSSSSDYGSGGNEVWGGRLGPLGWAISLLSAQLQSSLSTVVNYGTGGYKTRREAWGDMLAASRDYGRFNRDSRYLTNQGLIADHNIYKANRGLLALGDSRAFTEAAAQRYLKEATGLEPWRGSDLAAGGSSYKYGTSYYQVTPKGLTREWGYVGGYGEMQYFAATFYKDTGNTVFRDQAIKMIKARAPFRRPAIEISGSSNYRCMERIGLLSWRGVRESDGDFANEIVYGDSGGWSAGMRVAGVTLDPYAVGYAKQMLADNQYFSQLIADSRYYGGSFDARFMMEVYDDYYAVKNAADSGIRLPMTEGQPDSAWADEQSGIVAVKRGNERLWIAPYWQAKDGTGINGVARFHYSTPTYDQYGTMETNPQFDFSGSYYVRRADRIDGTSGSQYVPPSPPTQAYVGERLPVGNDLTASDHMPFRGKVSFYGFRFGNYLFGVNATAACSFELKTPAGFTSAPDLISGTIRTGPVTVGPNSTVVLYLPSSTDPAPVPTAPLSLTAIGSPTQISLQWSAASGATSYNVKRSLSSDGPYTTIASNVTATSFTDTDVTRAKTYYYVVSGVNANGQSYDSGRTVASAGLPAPWANQDIGTVVLPGSSCYLPGAAFRLAASGSAIGGTSDSFHFAYIPVTGDATIVAYVAMLNTTGADRAGVMMRESLAANSKFAAVLLEDGVGNVRLTRRTTTGGSASTSGSITNFWSPGWMKLERIGNTFNAYLSTDGVNWGSAFTSQTFTMNSLMYVGLATTSRTDDQLIVADYQNVQIIPGVQVVGAAYPHNLRPNSIQFTFDTDVSASLSPDDLQLTKLDGGAAPAVQSVQWNGSTKTATFYLPPGVQPDGNYRATLPAYCVNNTAGFPLNSDYTFDFFVLAGDANRDRVVDITDLGVLATNWQKSLAAPGPQVAQATVTSRSAPESATPFAKTQASKRRHRAVDLVIDNGDRNLV